jgi:4a-hydroxytetrahydrobiopterin dehydratase
MQETDLYSRRWQLAVPNHSEVETRLREAPEWRLDSGKLVRDWTFPDFAQAMVFVNRVAQLAESANHHPDIDIRYNKVRPALVSHDAGGITDRDLKMASRINQELR